MRTSHNNLSNINIYRAQTLARTNTDRYRRRRQFKRIHTCYKKKFSKESRVSNDNYLARSNNTLMLNVLSLSLSREGRKESLSFFL